MAMSHQERGRLGGKRTLALYGREHFRQLGKKGFRAATSFAAGGRLGTLIRLSTWGKIKMFRPAIELPAAEVEALFKELGL